MCWSANGSLATWAAAMVLAGATYGYEPKIWLFAFVFTQMQLIEYFLWKNLKVPRLNTLWSKAGLLVILLEPVAAIYMIEDVALRNKMWTGYATYVAALLLTQRLDFTTVVGGNGHLKWNWLPSTLLMIPWFAFFLAPLWIAKAYITFGMAVMTLLMSTYFYSQYGTISSMWCWIAVSVWLFMLLKRRG
jgi:hypothetical protein